MKYRLLIISIVFLCSCASDPWSKQEQQEFLQACKDEGAKKKYCKCFMEVMMEKYPRYEESKNISFEESYELSLGCE